MYRSVGGALAQQSRFEPDRAAFLFDRITALLTAYSFNAIVSVWLALYKAQATRGDAVFLVML